MPAQQGDPTNNKPNQKREPSGNSRVATIPSVKKKGGTQQQSIHTQKIEVNLRPGRVMSKGEGMLQP